LVVLPFAFLPSAATGLAHAFSALTFYQPAIAPFIAQWFRLWLLFHRGTLRWASQQVRQLGDVGGDAPCLMSRRAPLRLLLEIDVGQRLPGRGP
jgi:hypothetical protein